MDIKLKTIKAKTLGLVVSIFIAMIVFYLADFKDEPFTKNTNSGYYIAGIILLSSSWSFIFNKKTFLGKLEIGKLSFFYNLLSYIFQKKIKISKPS